MVRLCPSICLSQFTKLNISGIANAIHLKYGIVFKKVYPRVWKMKNLNIFFLNLSKITDNRRGKNSKFS
jgi:hypothetical protein